jgi:hypothetical protein
MVAVSRDLCCSGSVVATGAIVLYFPSMKQAELRIQKVGRSQACHFFTAHDHSCDHTVAILLSGNSRCECPECGAKILNLMGE